MPHDFSPFETVTVRVDSILRDPRYQVRNKLSDATIERYAKVYQSGNEMPPVEVARINQSLVLLEGWHRLAALDKIGRTTVEAVVHEVGEREAHWLAAKANLTHGLPLKPKELREVFRKYVHARKHRNKDGSLKSYREIATELGGLKAYTTIRNWMKADFPKIFQEYAGEDAPSSEGGLRDVEAGPGPKEIALASVNQAIAAFGALDSPEDRQEVREVFQEALRMLDQGDDLRPVEYPSDF